MASRRERYESANMRGGLGVRKRLSEESFRPTYRLNGVQRGATVNECLDKYGRWEFGYRQGVLLRKTAHWVYVKWDDEDETASYEQGDARYKVDRGFWKITSPRIGDPLSGEQGIALTTLANDGKMGASANAGSTDRGDDEDMASKETSNAAAERKAAQAQLKNGGFTERETYTAKQVAMRCGTDSKTMRKFFRSKASTVEPVGQGGRYEFDAKDLPKIQAEFKSWRKKADTRTTTKSAPEPDYPQPGDTIGKRGKDGKMVITTFTPSDGDHDRPTPKASMTTDELADVIERVQDEEPTDEEILALEADLDDLDGEDIE